MTGFIATGGRFPVLVTTSDRREMLGRTLAALLAVRGVCAEDVFAVQDGDNALVAAVLQRACVRAHQRTGESQLSRETRYVAGVTQPGRLADMVFHGCRLGGVTKLLGRDHNVERLRQLFRLGCPTAVVNAQDADGWTALRWASTRGHEAVVSELLAHGLDVNIKDKDGWTALMSASYCGHLAVVRLLCDAAGIDLAARRNSGATALGVVLSDKHALGLGLSDEHAEVAAFLLMATPEPPHLPQPRLHVVLRSFSSAGPGEMTVARGQSVLVEAEGASGWTMRSLPCARKFCRCASFCPYSFASTLPMTSNSKLAAWPLLRGTA